ncbi:hypothetical protein BJV82DRAFT_596591 [Fennellomyces sp. T-0311]|nr:hypothetical protein BJV82DRAFT_596591 [Fennellomyces sp. T-0311]
MDGAVGVIIYDQIPFEKDPRAGLMNIPPGNISIVAYYVDLDIGLDLLRKLQQEAPLMHDNNTNASYQKGVKVILYPAVGGFPSAWEFTLIVVVALLAVSFLASVGMHYHLWRIRRRQRLMFENGLLPPPFTQAFQVNAEKKVIDPSMLTLFPTRTIGDEADKPQQRRNSSESIRSTRSGKALQNAEALAISVENQAETAESSTSPRRASAADLLDDACVICLDEFSSGDTVRKLPCGHEYHRECIDPWLTIKSASCPLCKHDCSLDVPKAASDVDMEPASTEHPTRSNSPFSLRIFGNNNSSTTSSSMFGPTIRADQAEEFSRSWMARSLPRNMRRQINQAAAAARGNDGPAIELPARMTAGPEGQNSVTPPPPSHQRESTGLRDRLVQSLPRQWRL